MIVTRRRTAVTLAVGAAVGRFPGPPQVTTPCVMWGSDTVIASGEMRLGVRTAAVWRVSGTPLA